jgi:HEPN domain-containing protein
MMSADDRTTPFGLFNYARSYWQSAVHLHHAKVKVTHPDAAITLLLAHAVELYIKAYLRLQGLSAEDLKTSFGHDFRRLIDEGQARGLHFDEEDKEVAAILTEQESIRRSRYIETGSYTRPSLRALSAICKSLDQAVAAALAQAGHPVRNEALHHIETD